MKSVLYTTLLLLLMVVSCKDEHSITSVPNTDTVQPSLTLTSPAGGEEYKTGSSQEITWSSNTASTLLIEFSSDGGTVWDTLAANVVNSGSYSWSPLPDVISSKCLIRISISGQKVNAVNEKYFSIVDAAPKSITLLQPLGGDVLYADSLFTIKWQSAYVNNINIAFSSDNGASWLDINPSYPADSGKYVWKPIPRINSKQCLVKLTDVLVDTVSDISISPFTITSTEQVTVTSPNGGEVLTGGSDKEITWNSTGISNVKIEYTTDNGMNWNEITGSTPSDGYYLWSPVPNTPSNNCLIRITDVATATGDESDALFSISPEMNLSVVSPNGGEVWLSGSSQMITWTSAEPHKVVVGGGSYGSHAENININSKKVLIEKLQQSSSSIKNGKTHIAEKTVKLEYTTDNGNSWSLITGSTPNNGSYLWNAVPVANSSLCRIRISETSDGVPFDISDNTFIITTQLQQSIDVTGPAGGESWASGTSQNITWSSEGVQAVKIEYSINNGVSWNVIAESVPSSGFYTWDPIPGTPSTNCKIRISDAADGLPASTSGSFIISPEPDITVTSPNGGETLQAGTPNKITWTSTNIADVKIEFSTNSGASWNTVAASTPSDGSYEWSSVPDVNSSLCRIRVSDAADGLPYDISDDNFEVSNQVVQTLAVTSPNGGEIWNSGTSQNITWDAVALTFVDIDYTTNNGLTWNSLAKNIESSGSYEWSPIPDINSTQCKVRINDAVDDQPVDESNAAFTIKPVSSLKLVSPNGGESYVAGDSVIILWDSKGVENVKIEYTVNNGLTDLDWHTLVASTPSDGKYTTGFSIPSKDYRIRISDAVTNFPKDESDGTFTVTPAPTVNIINPKGGETWISGTNQNIKWESSYLENVKIEFTTNNGATWSTISSSTSSDGLYIWNIPSVNSSLCKVRVSDAADGNPSAVSDTTFTIDQQGITITAPNGGETWDAGSGRVISWTSTGVSDVKIDYSTNNGLNWNTIVNSTPSDGYYLWNPVANTPSNNCIIRISDIISNSSDQSDGIFSIAPESYINVISPNGTENWLSGNKYEIRWNSTNVENVNIDFTLNNGATWTSIVSGTESDGSYNWTAPAANSDQCRIRISDAADSVPSDTSDENFSIRQQPMVRVLFPNGGETITRDTTITWTSTGVANVNIDYTTNNGISWVNIVNNTPSTGAYQWNIPVIVSSLARIRVTSSADPAITDESDSYFNLGFVPAISLIHIEPLNEVAKVISWKSSGNVNKVKIEYSADNGKTWKTITTGTNSRPGIKNEFTWNNRDKPDKVKLRITDLRTGKSVISK